jgi:hypothetical protein
VDTEPEQDRRGVLERLREVALWIRDSSLGVAGFTVLLMVAIAGWTVSFVGLHTFAIQHMSLSDRVGWLVPVCFDGAPGGLTLVVMRAASHGRSGSIWRWLIVFFTSLSCWINYEHIHDTYGRCVAALMPLAAVVDFEALISEARKAYERRKGIEPRPYLHPLRFVFDWSGSWAILRAYVLDLPLPESLAASQRRAATRTAATPRKTTATATPSAAATPASPSAASASPAQALPDPAQAATATPATPANPAVQQPASAPAASQPKTASPATGSTTSNEARDLDEVAEVFRKLQAELGKSPSDKALAEALGVGRSRAQQLRTAAIEAGHADLAKPLRAA